MTTAQLNEYAAMRRMMRMVCHPTDGFSKSLGQAVLRELTIRQQEAVYLYYVRQMPMREVAETLGVDISTVSRTLQRARARLQRVLGYLPRYQEGQEKTDFVRLMTER